jgi:hypothetical protein
MTRIRTSLVIKIGALLFYFLLAFFLAKAQVVSDFNVVANGNDGWTIFNTSNGSSIAAIYSSTGGNPATGGYVNDGGTTSGPTILYAEAPAKFRGNHSFSYNQNLTFDLKTDFAGGTDNTNGDLVISNSSVGITLYYQLPSKPGTSFTSYTVTLSESFAGWHFGSPTGTVPTQTQIKIVLSNITSLRIRTKYILSNTFTVTGSLDNVIMNVASLPTAPTITSFTPTAGLPGTSVTITGTNFNSLATKNIVYFNGSAATVTSATTTQLIVTSPSRISLGPITVVNTGIGTQATTRTNFNPLFDNNKDFGGRVIASSFSKYTAFGTPPTTAIAQPSGFSVGDLDGDGWQDVLTSRNDAGNYYAQVFRNAQQTGNITSSSFDAAFTLNLPNSPVNGAVGRVGQTAIADMDSDGKLDVIVNVGYNNGGNYDNSFVIFLNQSTAGNLSFASGYIFQVSTTQNNNQGIAVGDMDGDGRPELLLALINSASHLGILQNMSTPGNLDFAYVQDFAQGVTMGVDISLGDLTGDDKPEVLVQAYSTGAINVYENTSTVGAISLGTPFNVSSKVTANIKVVDLDNDGKNDIFFRDFAVGGAVRIKKNNHSAGALTAADFGADIVLTQQILGSLGSTYSYSTAVDVNGDNKIDILAADGTNVAVFQNNYTSGALSASSFYAGTTFEGGNNSNEYVLCADIDGDNKPEILIRPSNTTAVFWVYHNESFPAPRIDTMTPSSGLIGGKVSFTGDYFSTGVGFPPIYGRLGAVVTPIVPSSNTIANTTVLPSSISNRFSFTEHGLTTYSKPFSVLFGPSQVFSSSSFGSNIDLPLTGTVREVLGVADFDDDGKADLAVIDNGFTAKIFKNTQATPGQPITSSSLTLQGTTYSSGSNLIALDIDGDGKTDLYSSGGLLQNTSSGSISFTSVTSSVSSFMSTSADFNKDGKTDLLLTTGGPTIQVYENLSRTGAFTANGAFQNFGGGAINLTAPSNVNAVVAADFDGDGFDDIITVNPNTNNSTYFLNSKITGGISAASFSSLGDNPTSGLQPYDITANDFDGDGKIDIAITYYNSAFVSVLLNTSSLGNISFTGSDIAVANKGYKINSQDLDGDGKLEIVIIHQPNPGPGSYTVLQNKCTVGTVSFTATNIGITRNPQAINFADINGDQKPDILILASGGSTAPVNALMVFENKTVTPVMSITAQPNPVYSVCNGAAPTISTLATGTTNITYQWQIFNSASGTYVDLTNTGGYSNASTSSLTINSTGNFGAGTYRCKINGDFAATIYSNTVSFTVNALPPTPVTSNVNNCGPGSIVLNASGGSNGNYLWYDTNGLISGQVNSAYTTPVISLTTAYSVAITNGICNSTKATIIATINTVPVAPITQGANQCVGNTFLLTASGGINGQYVWYSTPSGGSAIPGEVNSTYTTSVLTTSTTFYVSINNGTCESARSSAIATVITSGCNAPVITPAPLATQVGGSVSLNLISLITTVNSSLNISSIVVTVQPASGAIASVTNGVLTINYSGITFSGTEQVTIQACDTNGNCSTQVFNINVAGDIVVYNGISPGGKNPAFVIEYINLIPETKDNTVHIFDRWQNLVWHGSNYDNSSVVFTGTSDGGSDLPSGVYYYKINFASGRKTETGFISLRRQ